MNFFKRLFGAKQTEAAQEDVAKIENEGTAKVDVTTTKEDLAKILKPLIKKATRMVVQPPSRMPEQVQFTSHFGGQPYFEQGEKWPISRSGNHLNFIFQVFNTEGVCLPAGIKLVQFYYDMEAFPWDTSDDGWLVKIYRELHQERALEIPKPEELEKSKFCTIQLVEVQSLPNWEGVSSYSKEAAGLCEQINPEEPWQAYEEGVEKLTGSQDYQSQFGGYPKWVQGESTPDNAKGEPKELLFQVDSEENADLMWGDMGLVYVFYDKDDFQNIAFTLQCH